MADAPAPTAPPAPAPAPSPTPTAPPAPSGVTPAIAQPPTPSAAPKPGSAKAKMREDLAKLAKPANGARDTAPAPAQPDPAKPADPAAAPASPDGKPVNGKPGAKESPWKLVDRYKGRVTELESEIAKLKTTPTSPEDRKAFEERVTKAESRVKELEQHMSYLDYSQTSEYKEKYVQPYEKAWENAISELKEIKIVDGDGNSRDVQPQDILTLVNMPLGEARELADKHFGKFADDVMAHRKEISKLWQSQQKALADAKKKGGETLKQQQEAAQKNFEQLRNTIKTEWDAENAAVAADKTYGPFFSKRDGDEAWNTRLQKGFELVDKAFSQNPSDPKLTPDQRQAIIRLHTAVRNRAAGWGAMKAENETLRGQVEEMKKELEQYKGSEPSTAGGRSNGNGVAGGRPMTARERMHAELAKISKPR